MHYYHRHHHEDGDGYGYDGDETKVLIHFHTASLFLFFLLLIQTDDAYKKKANKTTRRDKRGPNDETLFRRLCPRLETRLRRVRAPGMFIYFDYFDYL